MRQRNMITLHFLNSDNRLLLFYFSYKFTIALWSFIRWLLDYLLDSSHLLRGPYLLREEVFDLFWLYLFMSPIYNTSFFIRTIFLE